MADNTYRVVSPVAGYAAGETFKAADHPELNLAALVEGGFLEVVTRQKPRRRARKPKEE